MNSIKKIIGLLFVCFFLSSNNVNAQDQMLGEIRIFAGNFAPRGWAFCEGQLLAINSNTALFSLIGTMYGGDGRTTFGLPDLRGRAVISAGRGPGLQNYVQGQRGGSEFTTLTTAQLPTHNHAAAVTSLNASINVNEEDGNSSEANGRYFGLAEGASLYNSDVPDGTTKMGAGSITVTGGNVAVGQTGGSQQVDKRQPYLPIRYIIALQGYYPSRS